MMFDRWATIRTVTVNRIKEFFNVSFSRRISLNDVPLTIVKTDELKFLDECHKKMNEHEIVFKSSAELRRLYQIARIELEYKAEIEKEKLNS
jgi:hypothetical protein